MCRSVTALCCVLLLCSLSAPASVVQLHMCVVVVKASHTARVSECWESDTNRDTKTWSESRAFFMTNQFDWKVVRISTWDLLKNLLYILAVGSCTHKFDWKRFERGLHTASNVNCTTCCPRS